MGYYRQHMIPVKLSKCNKRIDLRLKTCHTPSLSKMVNTSPRHTASTRRTRAPTGPHQRHHEAHEAHHKTFSAGAQCPQAPSSGSASVISCCDVSAWIASAMAFASATATVTPTARLVRTLKTLWSGPKTRYTRVRRSEACGSNWC